MMVDLLILIKILMILLVVNFIVIILLVFYKYHIQKNYIDTIDQLLNQYKKENKAWRLKHGKTKNN